jgi:2-isopropylmalate synthase
MADGGPKMNGDEPLEIIYDWNSVEKIAPLTSEPILFMDETLRDGLQAPSVVDPPVTDKIMLVHTMDDLGIHSADVGLPGAGQRAYNDVLEICREIGQEGLSLRPAAAARTLDKDIQPIIDISQKTGVEIEVLAFIGTSPIRKFVEAWEPHKMYRLVRESIRFARSYNLPVTFVTEDTTRARPDTLYPLYHVAVEAGASRICLCDTVGHATPDGLKNLIRFTKNIIAGMGKEIKLDWHGHNDRGLGLVNTIHAIEEGVTRVHGTALGIGERCGNAAMDQILMNLKLLGAIDNDLSKLLLYCKQAALATHWQIPKNYPLVGSDAFRTSTGVHAAAILKARDAGEDWLADRIYSGIPAGMFGLKQKVEVGHMSGESNVLFWLDEHRFERDAEVIKKIMEVAKSGDRVLDDIELEFIANRYSSRRTIPSKRKTRKPLQAEEVTTDGEGD